MHELAAEEASSSRISFESDDIRYMAVYLRALEVLRKNVANVSGYPQPVLTEGSNYGGIWLECAPHEGLAYSLIRPDIARANHLAFFAQQRDDGQIPCWIRKGRAGFGQIQMAVPIAATALELAQQTGDGELLEKAYEACRRWDAWLRLYRDTRNSGLCEGFCTWDTGQDNSPRWTGVPNRCEDGDARKCPATASLPRLCPDLSATVYGGRKALAAMAKELGKTSDQDRWLADAENIRVKIVNRLYVAEDAAFYDLDAHNRFVRIRSDAISRVLGEHVVDQKLFEAIYQSQIHNPSAFWAAYPLPSIALNDSAFVRPIPRNSWGGASQALTALRAPRWMEHYGKPADLANLMEKWVKAILGEDKFLQQLDPIDGKFTPDQGNYSPAALVYLAFTWRLRGVRQVGENMEWNVRPPIGGRLETYRLRLSSTRIAELKYKEGGAELSINGHGVCHVSGTVRLISDTFGDLKRAIGIADHPCEVDLRLGRDHQRTLNMNPNGIVML